MRAEDADHPGAAAGDHRRLPHPRRQRPRHRSRSRCCSRSSPAASRRGCTSGWCARTRRRWRRAASCSRTRIRGCSSPSRSTCRTWTSRSSRAALDEEIGKVATAKVERARAAEGEEPAGGARGLSARAGLGAGDQHRRRLGRVARSGAAVHQRRQVRRGHRRRRAARGQEVPGEDQPEHADAGAGQAGDGGREEVMRAHNIVAALLCSCTMTRRARRGRAGAGQGGAAEDDLDRRRCRRRARARRRGRRARTSPIRGPGAPICSFRPT